MQWFLLPCIREQGPSLPRMSPTRHVGGRAHMARARGERTGTIELERGKVVHYLNTVELGRPELASNK